MPDICYSLQTTSDITVKQLHAQMG